MVIKLTLLWLLLGKVSDNVPPNLCRVIPNQFSKSLDATDSELDETWCVSSACGFMKPDKISLLYFVWLPVMAH